MILFPHGFQELGAFAQWTAELGGIQTAIDAQLEGVSQIAVSPVQVRSSIPASSQYLPAAAPFDKAPNYLREIVGDDGGIGWLSFLGIGYARLLTRQADLLSALRFITTASVDREWTIERNGDGYYRVIAGDDGSVDCTDVVLLHTHRNRCALPSEADLRKMEDMATDFDHRWSFIYSRQRKGHQLSFIERMDPCSFSIKLWTLRRQPHLGRSLLTTRHLELQATFETGPGIPKALESLEVVERSLAGEAISHSLYDYARYPDRNIQTYWQAVLTRTV